MLKFYREKKKITQEKLAREVEVSTRTIQNIEKTNKTDVSIAIRISKVLGYTVEEIFDKEKHCEK